MTNLSNKIKIAILGRHQVGKSAITVRYLTKRFIGEYSSAHDFLYKHTVNFEENHVPVEIEILDTCSNGCSYDDVFRWADSFLVIYSIVDRDSFQEAEKLLKKISKLKLPSYYTALMLGNKNDLEHSRTVSVSEAQEVSLNYNCQFLEVSAAESYSGVQLAFHSLLKETRSSQLHRNLPIRRKLGVNSVSKALGNIFGKNSKADRKRPSLSI
ncbi:ras-related and estrogen-regulated growth inhibitor-like protein [Chironomus tepperi]|uniref:ras-related and estrogen-regulated growth inhibitor-like protein n=1 Tax=Chironomus tepperi TaxID=113505 RepID=UPI00391F04A2